MKIRYVFFVLPIIIGLIASATGFTLVWRLFLLSILVPVISYLWTFINIRGIRSQIRSLPPKAQVGDILEDQIKLTNLNTLPKLLLEIEENNNVPGYSNVASVNLPSKGSYNLNTQVHCSMRGLYHLGSFKVSASDPLGLFKQSRSFGQNQEILIYPNLVDLPFFDPLTYVNQGYGSGRWLEHQISPNVASIRDYVSGDSLKNIHWKSAAHSSKLMVKVFDPDRSHSSVKTIWVAVDLCHSAQAGFGIQSTEEYGITIAASIVKKYIENGWPVGLIAMAQKPYLFLPEMGNQQLESMATALATMKAQGTVPIEKLIADESGHFDLNTMVIIVTPSWNDRLVSPIVQVKGQQAVVVTVLLDPRSFDKKDGLDSAPRSLALQGVQVYVIKKGDNLASVLDSRRLLTSNIL
jgi:uncharacterized protein (DUF58 family)